MLYFKTFCRVLSFALFMIFLIGLFLIPDIKADVSNIKLNTDGSHELQNEEMIWVSPTDSNIVMAVWRDFRLGYRQVAIGVSTNGGYTWVDSLIKGGIYSWDSDPAIWCDRFGNFYPLTLNINPSSGRSGIALWKTINNGASWTGPYYAVRDTIHYFSEDKEFMTIDRTGGIYDGNIYIGWARFPTPTRIMFVRSTDGGINWSDTLVVGSPSGGSSAGQFTFPLVDAFGNVYVVWAGSVKIGGNSYYGQKMVKSTDGGQTFTPPKAILLNNYVWEAPGGINIYNMCAMDADITYGPYRGNIYLAVPDGVYAGPDYHSDILFIKSTDGWDTWSTPLRVNDDPEDLPICQFHPWMVVNQEGVIIIFFYDQRNDPPEYRKFDSYITFSFDGGETFTTNYRVSNVSSDPGYAYTNIAKDNLYQPPQPPSEVLSPLAGLLGEYISVSAYYDRVHCVWTDTREGNQDVYYSNFKIPFLAPRLYRPNNGIYISDAKPELLWSACGFFDEIKYNLEISTDSTFATIDFLYSELDTNRFTITSPLNEVKYFWRVKAYPVADTSNKKYSTIRSFIIDTTSPGCPVLISPADNSALTDTMPQFTWSGVTPLKTRLSRSPVYYNLQVSSDSNFNPGPLLFEYTDIYATSFDIPDVLPDHKTYYWRVKAKDTAGNEGSWQEHPFRFWLQVYKYGDANGDNKVSVTDVVYLINYLFKGGPLPVRSYTADNNCDGKINVSDVIYLINYLFKGGPPPCS